MSNRIFELYDNELVNAFLKACKFIKCKPYLFKDKVFYFIDRSDITEVGHADNKETFKKIKVLSRNPQVALFLKTVADVEIDGRQINACPIYSVLNKNDILQFTIDGNEWIFIEPTEETEFTKDLPQFIAFNILTEKNEFN